MKDCTYESVRRLYSCLQSADVQMPPVRIRLQDEAVQVTQEQIEDAYKHETYWVTFDMAELMRQEAEAIRQEEERQRLGGATTTTTTTTQLSSRVRLHSYQSSSIRVRCH